MSDDIIYGWLIEGRDLILSFRTIYIQSFISFAVGVTRWPFTGINCDYDKISNHMKYVTKGVIIYTRTSTME